MEPVNHRFELSAQAVKIRRRGYHQHISRRKALIHAGHIIALTAAMLRIVKAAIAAQAGGYVALTHVDDLHVIIERGTAHKSLHKHISITTRARAS